MDPIRIDRDPAALDPLPPAYRPLLARLVEAVLPDDRSTLAPFRDGATVP